MYVYMSGNECPGLIVVFIRVVCGCPHATLELHNQFRLSSPNEIKTHTPSQLHLDTR